jgi:hypothetical protein
VIAVARRLIHAVNVAWRGAKLSRVALGKYIIAYASLLHLGWAVLLVVDPRSQGATPVHIIALVCGGPYRSAVVLALVAIAAGVFPFLRSRVSTGALALMLIPQQAFLFMSAGAGIYAAVIGHYADGVPRASAFIFADQLPVILASLLYTIAVLEAAFERPDIVIPSSVGAADVSG